MVASRLLTAVTIVLGGVSFATATGQGRALDYLAAHQDPTTGGYSSGDRGDTRVQSAYTQWVAIAVAAAAEDASAWSAGTASLRQAVAASVGRATATGDLLRGTLAVALSGGDPRATAGRNLVAEILARQAAEGGLGPATGDAVWAILALRAAGGADVEPAIQAAAAGLVQRQAPDGGWRSDPGQPRTDAIATAAAIQGLVASGMSTGSPELKRAATALRAFQRADGGFGASVGEASDALTTAWATTALRSLGRDPAAVPWNRGGGPAAYLLALQQADGRMAYRPGQEAAPVWTSALASIALAARPLPVLAPRGVAANHGPRIVARRPAPGGSGRGAVIIRYRDHAGGTGVDPASVRIRIDGRDQTANAAVTAFSLSLTVPSAGRHTIRVDLADRAGNRRTSAWQVTVE